MVDGGQRPRTSAGSSATFGSTASAILPWRTLTLTCHGLCGAQTWPKTKTTHRSALLRLGQRVEQRAELMSIEHMVMLPG